MGTVFCDDNSCGDTESQPKVSNNCGCLFLYIIGPVSGVNKNMKESPVFARLKYI